MEEIKAGDKVILTSDVPESGVYPFAVEGSEGLVVAVHPSKSYPYSVRFEGFRVVDPEGYPITVENPELLFDVNEIMKKTPLPGFTMDQTEALERLEEVFGPVDPLLHNVRGREHVDEEYGYRHWITRNVKDILQQVGQLRYAATFDPEIPEAGIGIDICPELT